MLKKFLSVWLILGICTCSAFAAYGTVVGYSLASGQSVINPDTGNQAYKFSTSAESIDESVYADYIQNLYAKTSIVDRNSGVIYKFGQITKHYVNYAEAFTWTW